MSIYFDNSYARLPARFYARQSPVAVSRPRLIKLNLELATKLGLDSAWLNSCEGLEVLSGNSIPDGAEPIAMAYAGHQFGGFVPQLGDGRAILLGEILDTRGERFDIQLKGAGRTPFSRTGDGRAWLGPVLREYIVSESMHALGIPTTRSLAAIATGEPVYRETALPGAVLTRIARSHVRIGTFEYFFSRGDTEGIRCLADYVIDRHYPEVAESEQPYRELLLSVISRQADLIAQWLGIGFIHGVMNTDNTSIVGETIDYGPCAFMDTYHPETVYSSIDTRGRYAYNNQPRIAHWNLSCFAQSLLPIFDDGNEDKSVEEVQAAVDTFPRQFEQAYLDRFRKKLGLFEAQPDDSSLINTLLEAMAATGADFTNTFRALCDAAEGMDNGLGKVLHDGVAGNDDWLGNWHARLTQETTSPAVRAAAMRRVNPAVIPRNHLVESVLEAAVEGEFNPLEKLLEVLASPWDEEPRNLPYRRPPEPHEVVHQTFCGT